MRKLAISFIAVFGVALLLGVCALLIDGMGTTAQIGHTGPSPIGSTLP